MHLLEFNNVSYSYRGNWMQKIDAVKDISFHVPEHARLGFLGANGAGKSTSIKIIMGLLFGHRGKITLFNEELGNPDLRKDIGYLPEQPFFYENLAVSEYLQYLGRLSQMDDATLKTSCDYIYERLALGDLRDRKLGSFSKGMRQRFGLAQAIVHRPRLLVLDEPFSGLDPIWRSRFKDIMREQNEKYGSTLFFSSHILADVEELCQDYVLIDQGKTIEQGHIKTLTQNAPLEARGEGNLPPDAEWIDSKQEQWQLIFPDTERTERLFAINNCGAELHRLERQRLDLEQYFVQKVQEQENNNSQKEGAN